jgi:threonine dehydrogenase-like Zn-dependent dehydrogenase
VIHSDFERGFIAAQIVSFEDLVACGSEAKAREAGKLRIGPQEAWRTAAVLGAGTGGIHAYLFLGRKCRHRRLSGHFGIAEKATHSAIRKLLG